MRTTKRRNKDGSIVEYFQLAHNERHPETNVPTQRIIHNFGRADQLERQALVRLCHSIARVCGIEVRDPLADGGDLARDVAGLPKDMTFLRTVELGTVLVIEALWEELGIGSTLRRIAQEAGYKKPYERALLAMTANRLCEPESKLGVWDRWVSKVHLPSCRDLKLAHMYEAMDLFHEHAAEIEEAVFFKTADLLNLEVDVVFYDTTTASFSIDDADCGETGMRKFGHPKEGGFAPQVIVALAVTRDGLPIRSWVFPGNTTDITTVEKVKADLKGWKLGRAMFVADAGMNSEQTRKDLAKACGKYLLAARMASVKEIKDDVLSRPGRYKVVTENLHAKEVVVGDGVLRQRYILCYNPREAERERKHREQVVRDVEEMLEKHPEKKATAGWAITLKASGRYGRYLKITSGDRIQIDREAIRDAARYDGKWVVMTNDDTITAEEAAAGYKSLLVIERCFRSLKRTQIKMTPMYHWLDRRIETHVKICVLALLIERVAERHCGKPWSRILGVLQTLQAGVFQTKNFQFFERNQPTPALKSILEKLGTPLPKRVFGISSSS